MIIWDSKNLRSEEVAIGSFSVSIKFALDGCGPLWISVVYGPNNPSLRKDFWVELFDIYGLTYPLWCVGGSLVWRPEAHPQHLIGLCPFHHKHLHLALARHTLFLEYLNSN